MWTFIFHKPVILNVQTSYKLCHLYLYKNIILFLYYPPYQFKIMLINNKKQNCKTSIYEIIAMYNKNMCDVTH